jgi:hypothetical protein
MSKTHFSFIILPFFLQCNLLFVFDHITYLILFFWFLGNLNTIYSVLKRSTTMNRQSYLRSIILITIYNKHSLSLISSDWISYHENKFLLRLSSVFTQETGNPYINKKIKRSSVFISYTCLSIYISLKLNVFIVHIQSSF